MTTKSKKNKQLSCKWIIPCQNSTIDNENNTLSLSGIIEEVTIQLQQTEFENLGEAKSLPMNIDLIVMWEREEGVEGEVDLDFTLQFIDPKGEVLMDEAKGVVKMEKHHRRFRTRFKIGGLRCSGPGLHKFRVVSNDKDKTGKKNVCEESLMIKMVNPEGKEMNNLPKAKN